MSPKVPLFKMHWAREEIKAIKKVIKRGSFWATGPEIEEFEKKLAEFTGRKYALTFNSGTSALHAMLLAFNIESKEVIVPSFTFIATANAVVLAGGKPVFAESETETYGLDADDVEKRITDKTKAIMALSYGGGVSRDIEKLHKIAEEKGILLLEDNAHSFGVKKKGKMCGTFGAAAALSFCQNKLITTGEGGAVITDSDEIYQKMKLIRSHGGPTYTENNKTYGDHMEIGYNYRMPTMCAALGQVQLSKFDKVMKKRISNANQLNEGLAKIKEITTPKAYEDSDHFYQMYTLLLDNKENKEALQKHLGDNGIASKTYYTPIHLATVYKTRYNYKEGDLPKTEELSQRALTLPMHPGLKKKEINHIVKVIKGFFKND